MKIHFIMIFSLFIHVDNNIVYAQGQKILKSIEYDVSIANFGDTEYDGYFGPWYRENIETSKRNSFLQILFDKVISNEIIAYDTNGTALSKEGAKKCKSLGFDTLTFTRIYPPYDDYDSAIEVTIEAYDIKYMRFREEWSYDSITFAIKKTITQYGPVRDLIIGRDNWVRYPLFWIHCDPKSKSKNLKSLTPFIQYNISSSCIDHDFDYGYSVHYIPKYKTSDTLFIRNYIMSLLSAFRKNKLKVHDIFYLNDYINYISDSLPLLNHSESDLLINDLFTSKVIYNLRRPEPPYHPYDSIAYDSKVSDVKSLRFYEEWLLNPETMELQKKLYGVAPLWNEYDESGEFKGYRPLFALFFKKPERVFDK